jgi:hypothetical protein
MMLRNTLTPFSTQPEIFLRNFLPNIRYFLPHLFDATAKHAIPFKKANGHSPKTAGITFSK